jgi:murein DD-endopeptidase MepM/ murein hydrolase activator NlpD
MGKKEKFIFNTATLMYEKVAETLKDKAIRLFKLLSTALVTAIIMLVLLYKYFPSFREQRMKSELDIANSKHKALEQKLEQMSKVVGHLQERDASVYRTMFGMEPLDQNVWQGGTGGSDRFMELNDLTYAGDFIKSSLMKAEMLERQLVLQSKSLDTIQKLARDKEKMITSIPSVKPVREDKLNRSMYLMSGFGWRLHPVHKVRKFHAGLDFAAPYGTAIVSTGQGRVSKIGHGHGYGNHVEIDHGYGYVTLYGHMSTVSVREGDHVKKGQVIGKVGSTGTSTAPHCHYEVHFKGNPVNPLQYCMDGLSPAEYQQMVNQAKVVNQSAD